MSADPTAEHVDAVARVVADHDAPDLDMWPRAGGRRIAEDVLTSTDPAVHAALAASLPAEVKAASMTDAEMLAALVDRGTLTEDAHCADARACEDTGTHCPPDRLVTPWEVAE